MVSECMCIYFVTIKFSCLLSQQKCCVSSRLCVWLLLTDIVIAFLSYSNRDLLVDDEVVCRRQAFLYADSWFGVINCLPFHFFLSRCCKSPWSPTFICLCWLIHHKTHLARCYFTFHHHIIFNNGFYNASSLANNFLPFGNGAAALLCIILRLFAIFISFYHHHPSYRISLCVRKKQMFNCALDMRLFQEFNWINS